jgi:hypothetical protein
MLRRSSEAALQADFVSSNLRKAARISGNPGNQKTAWGGQKCVFR